ncbi:putative metal-binding motif-containing protein [Pseudomonadota bacterium]
MEISIVELNMEVLNNPSVIELNNHQTSASIELPFETVIYGNLVDSFRVADNGYVLLNTNTAANIINQGYPSVLAEGASISDFIVPLYSFINQFVDDTGIDFARRSNRIEFHPASTLIAGRWNDLNPAQGTGRIQYQTFGTAPDRYTVIEFLQIPYSGSEQTVSFQIKIFETGCTDLDEDGFAVEGGSCGAVDCNDENPDINPDASEICNEIDDDCDALIDEDDDSLTGGYEIYADSDGDGYGDPNVTLTNQCVTDEGYVENSEDCDDSESATYPGAPELCDNVDNNCSEKVDEYCPAVYKEDGYEMLQSIDTTVLSSQDLDRLGRAKLDLVQSLGNRDYLGDSRIVWFDSDEVDCKFGHAVFDHEKQAVTQLGLFDNVDYLELVDDVIVMMVEADRVLAEQALSTMTDGKAKDKALAAYEDGLNGTDAHRQIQDYRNAWKSANKICDSIPQTCIDEIVLTSPDGTDTVSAMGDLVRDYDTYFESALGQIFRVRTNCTVGWQEGDVLYNGWTITSITEREGYEGTLAAARGE